MTSLGDGIARVLRIGTLLAVGATAAGMIAALVSADPAPGHTPIVDLIGGGGADALISIGLLALTLIPVVALGVAVVAFARFGERSRAWTAAGVMILLVGSLVVAAILGPAI